MWLTMIPGAFEFRWKRVGQRVVFVAKSYAGAYKEVVGSPTVGYASDDPQKNNTSV